MFPSKSKSVIEPSVGHNRHFFVLDGFFSDTIWRQPAFRESGIGSTLPAKLRSDVCT
jgi:hypothetical protein